MLSLLLPLVSRCLGPEGPPLVPNATPIEIRCSSLWIAAAEWPGFGSTPARSQRCAQELDTVVMENTEQVVFVIMCEWAQMHMGKVWAGDWDQYQ